MSIETIRLKFCLKMIPVENLCFYPHWPLWMVSLPGSSILKPLLYINFNNNQDKDKNQNCF